jgi:hypothetical protein
MHTPELGACFPIAKYHLSLQCSAPSVIPAASAAAAGLVCPKGFPAAFGSFPALETLMLRYNDFSGDTLGHVAEVRSWNSSSNSSSRPRMAAAASSILRVTPGDVCAHLQYRDINSTVTNSYLTTQQSLHAASVCSSVLPERTLRDTAICHDAAAMMQHLPTL